MTKYYCEMRFRSGDQTGPWIVMPTQFDHLCEAVDACATMNKWSFGNEYRPFVATDTDVTMISNMRQDVLVRASLMASL